jgi:hypothetical protein
MRILAGGYNDMGMPLQDIIDTFGYLLREANKLNLAYVTLVKYSAFLDPEYDGDGGSYFACFIIARLSQTLESYRQEARDAARRHRDLHSVPHKGPCLRQRGSHACRG